MEAVHKRDKERCKLNKHLNKQTIKYILNVIPAVLVVVESSCFQSSWSATDSRIIVNRRHSSLRGGGGGLLGGSAPLLRFEVNLEGSAPLNNY